MIIPVFDITASFRAKFPYVKATYSYPQDEYTRISRISDRWYNLHIAVAILFWAVISIILMFVFEWLTDAVYALLNGETVWFSQREAPFAVAGIFLGFPLGFLGSLRFIKLLYPRDHIYVMDRLNARLKYDSFRSWRLMVAPFGVCAAISLAVVGWSYVAVSSDHITIKHPFEFKSADYDFEYIKYIKHYRYYVYENKVEAFDHYTLTFRDGSTLFDVAPYIDYRKCIKKIAERAHISIVQDSIERH